MEKTSFPPTFAEKDLNYYLQMIRGDIAELEKMATVKLSAGSSTRDIVVLLTSATLGTGREELGKRLVKLFLQALTNSKVKPRSIILLGSAVNLATDASEVLGSLTVLQEQGIKILVCLESSKEFGVEQEIKIGILSDMNGICEHLLSAWKLISL